MRTLWSDGDAERLVAAYSGVERDLALRLYTARLLGGEPGLVLHGGGNVSLKTRARDLLGDEVDALCVKGSGWDMAAIEPAGLPALRLAPLRRLRGRASLSDEDMLRVLRAALLDPSGPNPSVETLLHAFLPHRFIDHTHATAVLSLADQPDGAARCADLYGRRVGIVPYLRPGYPLARTAAEMFDADPAVEGLVLLKHGVFTFGDSAREAYERMIAIVSQAEQSLLRGRRPVFVARPLPDPITRIAEVAPILRGACALPSESGTRPPFILDFRAGAEVLAFVNGSELPRYAQVGVATPDHAIRTKGRPLIVPPPQTGQLDAFKATARDALGRFAAEYRAYFARHSARSPEPKQELDPIPRVILVPGLGLFGLGRSAGDAAIAADIAESWVATVTGAEAIGRFESLGEAELFDIEYWSLEQAKLGERAEPPLAGHVAVVTGGAGTIGIATARAMHRAGAEIALLDRPGADAAGAAAPLGGIGLDCDVTDRAAVAAAFDRVVEHFGGVDIVVSNAGAAWQGPIGEVGEEMLRRSFELNFFAHQWVAQGAVRIMLAQGTGGCLLFNVSKQALNPGPNFGPYGLPKAATLALMRQYALEYGAAGIRANAVNADGIRGGLLTPEMVAQRAQAYGVSEAAYMSRNLLGREVTAEDVAEAFLSLALARNTTGGIATVDGGNIAAAPR
jgi:rhamnose utilization protein RhaD (predicted bifunctional aldolase and dehydrogenase)/NAD(P)-dependent dehydrogenase (short-subunit alcohol dehydrogenase family)